MVNIYPGRWGWFFEVWTDAGLAAYGWRATLTEAETAAGVRS